MIARYTEWHMRNLLEHNRTIQDVHADLSPTAARSRLYNAARRLRVRISTRAHLAATGQSGYVEARLHPDDRERLAKLGPLERDELLSKAMVR